MSSRRNRHRRDPRPPSATARRPSAGHGRFGTRIVPSVGAVPVTRWSEDRVRAVLEMMAHHDDDTIVFAEPDGEHHLRLGLRALPPDTRCGGAGLFGLSVPPRAALVGLSFVGTSGPWTSDRRPSGAPWPADPSEPERVRVDVVVTADGRVRARVHTGGGEPVDVVGTPSGIVVDALHRTIGLRSPGAPPPLTTLVAGMWMSDVLDRTAGDRLPSWSDAVTIHAEDLGRTPSGRRATMAEADVASRMQRLADEASWDDLHRAASIGRMAAPELAPDEADWMDATMFARWMVDSFPTPLAVVEHLDRCGAGEVARRITTALDLLDPLPWVGRTGPPGGPAVA